MKKECNEIGWRDKDYVTLLEAAKIFGLSSRTIYRLMAAGEFPRRVKVGRSSRIPTGSLIAYEARLANGVKP